MDVVQKLTHFVISFEQNLISKLRQVLMAERKTPPRPSCVHRRDTPHTSQLVRSSRLSFPKRTVLLLLQGLHFLHSIGHGAAKETTAKFDLGSLEHLLQVLQCVREFQICGISVAEHRLGLDFGEPGNWRF